MKAITIANPYPILILWPQERLRGGDVVKRTENRTWPCEYRGELIIHAGKSDRWVREGDKSRYPEMLFGYAMGLVEMTGCVAVTWKTNDEARDVLPAELRWIADHPHASGPFLHIYERPRLFATPVKVRGQQGLFDLPGDWPTKTIHHPPDHYREAKQPARRFDVR